MNKNNNGQSLFEVLFATAMAAIIVSGVASVALTSLRNALFARSQSEARQVAQNMLEAARIYRDNNFDDFFLDSDPGPTFSTCTPSDNQNECCPEEFTCTYQIDRSAANAGDPNDIAEVVANVSWTDATGTHIVRSETVFTKWEI